MVYGLLIGGTVLITIVLNILRLMTTPALNRWLLAGTSSLVVIWHGVLFDFYDLHWSVLLLIITGLVCFHWKGMTVAIMVSWLLVYSQSGILSFPLLLSYVFFGLGAALLFGYVKQLKRERSGRLRMLTASSRQLNVFREVSFTMQDTLDPDRLLQTILTSVTAGHGLGFNRSIIFFADLEKDSIYGVMGTGPMNPEDGFQIWEEITRQHYDLQGLIDEKETDSTHDEQLNERIRKMTIPFHGNHLFKQTLDSGRPLHVYASIAMTRCCGCYIPIYKWMSVRFSHFTIKESLTDSSSSITSSTKSRSPLKRLIASVRLRNKPRSRSIKRCCINVSRHWRFVTA